MKLDRTSSERLAVLRFPLIVGVVFIHAYFTDIKLAQGAVGVSDTGFISDFSRNIISQGIARIAVPLFFLMSGYFLFLDSPLSITSYKEKIQARVRTLLIPFLIWNILTLLLFALLQLVPAAKPFFSGKNIPIADFALYDYANAIFGIDKRPVAYQFWFIRDLMVLVLAAPLVQLALNAAPRLFLLAVFLSWLLLGWPLYIPSIEGLAFFYAGAYFASKKISLFEVDKFGKMIVAAYLVLLLANTLTKELAFNSYIHKTSIVIGIACALFLSRAAVAHARSRAILLWASGCSFFVFAFHEPTLTIIRKAAYKVLVPNSDLMVTALYFLIPIFVIALSLAVYEVMRRIAPKTLSIISGGR